MGKMTYAIILAVIVELSLWLWGAPQPFSPIFTWLFHLDTFYASIVWGIILASMLVVATSSIVPLGNVFFNVYGMYARIAVALIGLGIPIISLAAFINNALSGIAGIGIGSFGWIISALICSPLIIAYTFLTLDWVRGTDN